MAKYMIHACPKRMWYIEEYFLPSMLKQGINEEDITIYNDVNRDGNLESCLKSFESVPNDGEGTWHLQDDLILASNFKKQSEKYDYGIVYGFTGYYDKDKNGWLPPGIVKPKQMWSSFQCVRIPNYIALKFAAWFRQYMSRNYVYRKVVDTGKCDDWFFKTYLQSELKDIDILNLAPNIVDHVDRLIGGSVINGLREEPLYRARFWEEEELYEQLAKDLGVEIPVYKGDNNG